MHNVAGARLRRGYLQDGICFEAGKGAPGHCGAVKPFKVKPVLQTSVARENDRFWFLGDSTHVDVGGVSRNIPTLSLLYEAIVHTCTIHKFAQPSLTNPCLSCISTP